MNDRLRCPIWIGFFAGRRSIMCVGCMAAGVMLAVLLWPLASPAAAQVKVNIGEGERSLSVSGGCIQIRAGDQILNVGACSKDGDVGENPEAPQSSESNTLETTGVEQSIPETTSPDQETTSEAPEGTAQEPERPEISTPEATTPETAEPGSHGDDMPEGGGSDSCPEPPMEDEAVRAVVARAVDGDTLELEKPLRVEGVETTDRVRMIGVDSSELSGDDGDPEPYAEEAAAFTADMLDGAEVWLATDKEPLDAYGRLLAYVWIETPSENPPNAPSSDSEEPKPSANIEQPSVGEAVDEETMSLFNLALVETGLAEAMATEPNDAYAECFDAASRRAGEAGMGIHSDHPEGEVPDLEESTTPETMVSEQYAPEDDTPNEPMSDEPTSDETTPDEPMPDEPDSTEPEAAVSEQYTPPEVTVETTLETTIMAPDSEPLITTPEGEAPASEVTVTEEEPPAPEDTVAEEPATETLVAEEPVAEESGSEQLDPEEPIAALDAPAPSAELVLEESPGTSETRPPSDEITVSEGAATLSAPAESTYPAERASDHLAALPDTGGTPLARSSFGTLLVGLGLLASGVSLKLALRAGKTNPDGPLSIERAGRRRPGRIASGGMTSMVEWDGQVCT